MTEDGVQAGAAVRTDRGPGAPPEPHPRRVRAAFARLGGHRTTHPPELAPIIRSVRAVHPKADVKVIERAYAVAEERHTGQKRRSGEPYITHPLAVTQILADLGMTPPTLCAGLL